MQRTDILERKIKTAKDLHSIVKTMKGLAAVSINQYDHAVESVSHYFSTIEKGLHIILSKQPQMIPYFQPPQNEESKRIALVFGAGQPMCGAFNEVIASYFDRHWKANISKVNGDKIFVTGRRVVSNLERYNWTVENRFEMPTTIEAINDTVQNVVVLIRRWYSEENYNEVYLYYNRPEANAGYKPIRRQLLPIDLSWLKELTQQEWQGRSIPTYTMNSAELATALIKQLLFVSIYKAFAESLSAENNSRLTAMQVAEKKISDIITNLTKVYQNQRQVNITEEILDIMASFEVLTSRDEDSDSSR